VIKKNSAGYITFSFHILLGSLQRYKIKQSTMSIAILCLLTLT